MRRLGPVLVALLLVGGSAHALGPGDLDPDFNGGQPLTFDLARTAPRSTFLGTVLVDAVGRYLVVGSTTDADGNTALAIVRVTSQGSPDGTFGVGGAAVLQLGQGSGAVRAYTRSLGSALSPSGLLVSGLFVTMADGRTGAGAVRLLSNGAPDPGFGAGGSVVVQASPTMTGYAPGGYGGVASDDAVYVSGYLESNPSSGANRKVVLLKFDAAGTLVPSFGNGIVPGAYIGSFSQYPGDTMTYGGPIVPLSSGKVLVSGGTFAADSRSEIFLARFTAAGQPDAAFGTTGPGYTDVKASDPALASGDSGPSSMALGPDGSIYVAGGASDSNRRNAMAVTRFGTGGTVDTTFGSLGTRRVQVAEGLDNDRTSDTAAIIVEADGGILLIGTASDTQATDALVVVRMLSDGTLDPSFGSGGVLRPAIGSGMNSRGGGAALTSDGKLIVAGSLGRSPYQGFVARILLSTPVSPPPPADCSAGITFDAIVCRIDALAGTVNAQVALGSVHDRLAALLATARARTLAASTALAGRARKKAVRKPLRSLAAAARVLGSKGGRKLDGALRGQLKSSVRGLQGDLHAVAKIS